MESVKDKILSQVDDSDILNYYLASFHDKGRLKKGQNISNPFIYPERQKTPSFNIYPNSKGRWMYHDFATGEHGDCFELVMKLNRIDFKEALTLIVRDFNIWL